MTNEQPTTEQVLEKIKSRGYWQVVIRPERFEKERLKSLGECARLVLECKVVLRGWDYPHVGSRDGLRSGLDYVESLTDWGEYKELSRMYQSGQFVHLFGCHEDWWGERVSIFGPSEYSQIKPGSVLGILSTLYTVTESYEFASRLAQKNLFDNTIHLSIELHGMMNRKLFIEEFGRNLFHDYVCTINDLPYQRTIAVKEILGQGHDLALDNTFWIFDRFNWHDPPRDVFKEDQKKLLEHRL